MTLITVDGVPISTHLLNVKNSNFKCFCNSKKIKTFQVVTKTFSVDVGAYIKSFIIPIFPHLPLSALNISVEGPQRNVCYPSRFLCAKASGDLHVHLSVVQSGLLRTKAAAIVSSSFSNSLDDTATARV